MEIYMKDWSQFRDFGLYLVTDKDLCMGRPVLDVVRSAVRGGVQAVQIREKSGHTRDFLELAKLLVREIQSQGVPVIINDRVDIALASGAAGVHVGQSDMPILDARNLLGERALLGLTIPNMDILKESLSLPVQYVAVGPVFPTTTKANAAPAWGIEGMKTARAYLDSVNCSLPLMTIGGINAGNAKSIIDAGIDSLAVVSAICSAQSPELASREILTAWQ